MLKKTFVAAFVIFHAITGSAELECPGPQERLEDARGISFLLVCQDRDVAVFNADEIGAPVMFKPQSFSSFRQGPMFAWKYPAIIWNKQSVKTKWHSGYLVGSDAKRLEGELQLKVVQGQLAELAIRQGKKSRKFKAAKISEFGLLPDDPYIASIDGTFEQGDLEFVSGQRYEGKVRFLNPRTILIKPEDRQFIALSGQDLRRLSIERSYEATGAMSFVAADGVLARVVAAGQHYTLAVNPFPDPLEAKKGAKSFFKGMLKEVAVSAVTRGVAKGVVSTGGSLNAMLISADIASQTTYGLLQDPKVFRQEYFLVSVGGKESLLVHPETLASIYPPLLADCAAYQASSPSEKMVSMENIYELTQMLNNCDG